MAVGSSNPFTVEPMRPSTRRSVPLPPSGKVSETPQQTDSALSQGPDGLLQRWPASIPPTPSPGRHVAGCLSWSLCVLQPFQCSEQNKGSFLKT